MVKDLQIKNLTRTFALEIIAKVVESAYVD